jgi:hypothetical protein
MGEYVCEDANNSEPANQAGQQVGLRLRQAQPQPYQKVTDSDCCLLPLQSATVANPERTP